MKAAKDMGVSRADREAMEEWDGELNEEFTLLNGRWVDSNGDSKMAESPPSENSQAQPNEFYQQIYKQAEPHLMKLIDNPDDSEAIGKVKELNGRIFQHNEQQKLPSTHWQDGTIEYETIRAHVHAIMPFHQALIQNPADAEARQKWDDEFNMLKKFNKQNGYPST